MYKRVYFIALVPNYYTGMKNYTLYLFDKEEKVVVPVEIANQDALLYLTGKTQPDKPSPHLYNTVVRLLSCFQSQLVSITIYNYQSGTFYTYLNLAQGGQHYELNIGFSDAFVLAKMLNSPMYMRSEILEQRGIRVTKEILKDALRENV